MVSVLYHAKAMFIKAIWPVGTDVSRPLGLSNRRQGRDTSVPTGVSAYICIVLSNIPYHESCHTLLARLSEGLEVSKLQSLKHVA